MMMRVQYSMDPDLKYQLIWIYMYIVFKTGYTQV